MTRLSTPLKWTYEIDGWNEGSPKPINATDPHSAACNAVAEYERHRAEWPVASGERSIRVKIVSPGRVDWFEVTGETVPTYYSRWLRPEQ